MKIGFEIEFAAPYGQREILNDIIHSDFYCGTDSSANFRGFQGLEVRTTRQYQQGLPKNKLQKLLLTIKDHGGFVHNNCGVHFHFSGFGAINASKFLSSLNYKQWFWENRSRYCDRYNRYVPLRHIDSDHYECRVFNGTLNLRAFCVYYRKLREAIRESVH